MSYSSIEENDLQPQEMVEVLEKNAGGIELGLLANYADGYETRMLLTPEACGMLTSGGYRMVMESGAGSDISFSDEKYAEYGVKIVSREEALKAQVVLCYTPLKPKDIKKMQKGAVLLCMMGHDFFDKSTIKALMEHKIAVGCLDNMQSHNDEPVFSNIIDEINGRAAIMYAEEALSFLGGGKGVLLAGVAGINPCEILIIGMGNDMIAAAKAGAAAGARVTLMDNDISTLQVAKEVVGQSIDTIAIHPRVLFNRAKTADVIILGTTTRPFEFPANVKATLKSNVYLLDMVENQPSVCVPRTVAMAISNALVNFFDEMQMKNGFYGMVATTPGVQQGLVTYEGKLVDKLIGSYLGMPSVDINVMLSAAN
ncbi:MAG: hypothetical protein K2M93_07160 [Muribaculaceae bacterium]|nr:hypothetical protein [Muribaculaceae bacterium]